MFARIMGIVLLTGCGLLILGESGTPADEKPAPRTHSVGVGRMIIVETSNKKRLRDVTTANTNIVTVTIGEFDLQPTRYYYYREGKRLSDPSKADPNKPDPNLPAKQVTVVTVFTGGSGSLPSHELQAVGVIGRKVGKTSITLTDEDGKSETIQIEVRHELTLPVGITHHLPSLTGKALTKVAVEDSKIIRASVNGTERHADITTLAVGQTTLRVADDKGTTESIIVSVRNPALLLTKGEQKKLQLKNKQMLRIIRNDDPAVLEVHAGDDPTWAVIDAIGSGIANVVLIGSDNTRESFEIGVKSKGK
jgi:hypothetical protein